MKIGIDIVSYADFETKISRTPAVRSKVFTEQELTGKNVMSLSGIFAAKEAIIKTGYIKVGQWHLVQILNDENGAPYVVDENNQRIDTIQVSISHTQDTAVAVAIYVPNNLKYP